MKALTKAMKQMLDALAYAHAGEHLSQKEKHAILGEELEVLKNTGSQVFEPTKARNSSNVRRVALYLGSELPAEVMDYIIDTCSSLGHELTVLTFQARSSAKELLHPYSKAIESAGIDIDIETLRGEPISGLSRYLRSHPEIAFLACKESGYLGRSYMMGTQRKDALPVPVVVIASTEEGKNQLGGTISSEENAQTDVA